MHNIERPVSVQKIKKYLLRLFMCQLGIAAKGMVRRGQQARIDDLKAAVLILVRPMSQLFPPWPPRKEIIGNACRDKIGIYPLCPSHGIHKIALIDRDAATAPFTIAVINPVIVKNT